MDAEECLSLARKSSIAHITHDDLPIRPLIARQVPSPRPGICTNDSKSLPSENLNFVRTHSLMDEPVLPFFGGPLVVRTGLISRFTVIAVEPQVKTTEGKAYDVIFVGKGHEFGTC